MTRAEEDAETGGPARSSVRLSLVAFAAVVVAGAALRLVDLGNRPMHCDEAVHAVKFGRLLEHDDYVYDPREYHGPSLNYLTLPIARLVSAEALTEITEVHLRLVPALFGIVLVGLRLAGARRAGPPGRRCAPPC